jgi:hypothetical protein
VPDQASIQTIIVIPGKQRAEGALLGKGTQRARSAQSKSHSARGRALNWVPFPRAEARAEDDNHIL